MTIAQYFKNICIFIFFTFNTLSLFASDNSTTEITKTFNAQLQRLNGQLDGLLKIAEEGNFVTFVNKKYGVGLNWNFIDGYPDNIKKTEQQIQEQLDILNKNVCSWSAENENQKKLAQNGISDSLSSARKELASNASTAYWSVPTIITMGGFLLYLYHSGYKNVLRDNAYSLKEKITIGSLATFGLYTVGTQIRRFGTMIQINKSIGRLLTHQATSEIKNQ